MSKQFKENFEKSAEQVASAVKETLPKVSFNKNGYEIRTQVLDMAKDYTQFEYSSKWMGWETTSKKDPETGEFVTTVDMPTIPGVDEVLDTAQKFYDFIQNPSKK